MKVDIENISKLERKLNVEIPAEVVDATLEQYYRDVQKSAQLQGFRQGKAPMNIIKKNFKDRVERDVAGQIIRDHYVKALDELNIDPVSYPTIDYDIIEEGKPLKFTATFEIRPEVELKQYENLSVMKEKIKLPDDVVENILKNLRESKMELSPLLEDRPAQLGDVTIIDFVGKMNGVPFPGGTAQGHQLELGSNQFIPGFEEGISGMKIGQTKTISIKFPEQYHAAELAGQPVDFETTLKEIKKKVLPELTDEFAKSVGEHRDLAHLREEIEKDVRAGEEKRVRDELKNRVLKALVEANPIEVPRAMVTEQKKILIDDVHQKMERQGMGKDQFDEYTQKWDADFTKSAEFIIKSSLILDAIAKKEKLTPTDEDVEQRMENYAKQSGIELEKIKAFYGKPENRSRLKFQIMEEKVMDFLINKAKIKEVDRSELPKDEEQEA